MAKRFLGFTPEQRGKIVPELAGMQGDEQRRVIASNPAYQAKLGNATEQAMRVLNPQPIKANNGMYVKGFNEGGQAKLDAAQKRVADAQEALQAARDAQAANPEDASLVTKVTEAETRLRNAQESLQGAETSFKTTEMPSNVEMTSTAVNDPESLTTKTEVDKIATDDKQTITTGTGEVGDAEKATATTAETEADVVAPEKKPAPTVEATTVTDEVQKTLDSLTAATGLPSDEALAKAATMNPDELAQLGLTAAQITAAQTVKAPDKRKVEDGEMISGSSVDMDRVKEETSFEAATGAPSSDATVQGQLSGLMEDFEGKNPPAWAAGAMRAASAALAARGLSSSSMAGMAIVQAAMESAIPIASQDAKTAASFELQNLSNKQQSAMFAAQQRAEFLNLEFNQEFQTRVANAAKISDIANINFTAEQQIALENARLAQSVDLANLDAANAKVLSDAAAMTQMDTANLNNRQQAAIQQANAFLQMDMQNLENEQQTNVFKAQQRANALLSDQAAENAAKQFNASNQIQVDQFYDNLSSSLSMFNSEQANAQNRFNAGETNAIEQFNKKMVDERERFNASNQLIIEQANAAWYQTVATIDTAATNEANRADAAAATNMTALAFSAMMQETRDMMSYAWQSTNNDADRATQLAIAQLSSDDAKQAASAAKSSGFWGAMGNFGSAVVEGYLGNRFRGRNPVTGERDDR